MASLTNGWKLFSAAALTAAMLFTAVPAKAEAIPDGGTFTVTWAQNPVSLNPGLSSGISSGIPGAQLFASPLQYDDQWNPHPYLAEKWEMAPDGLSLTLHLVKGAKFHDGTPITSEDVAFSIMAIKANHPFKAMYAPVSGVDTPDPYTAVIRLSKPHPAILLCMSPVLCPIMPKHVYGTDPNIRQNPANKAPIGSGPFKFVEWKPGDYIMLEKNKDFFIKGKPHVDRVIIKIIPDMNNRVMAVERGEVDAMPFFDSLREVKRLSGDKNLVVTNKGYAGIGSLDWVAFNTGKKPFDDVRVRQAAAYAIDRNFFAKVIMMGLVTPSATPITPFSPFYTKDVNMYDVNLEKAKKLLDEAGYPVKADGTRFTVTVDYAPGSPTTKMMAEYLKPQLAKVGIDAKIRISPDFGTWAERVSNYNFDITTDNVFNWGDPVIGVHRTYSSANIVKGVPFSNTQQYRNPKVDAIMEQAASEVDNEKRAKLYKEFQQIVMNDVPIYFMTTTAYHTIYNKRVGNVPASIWGFLAPYMDVYLKKQPRLTGPGGETLRGPASSRTGAVPDVPVCQFSEWGPGPFATYAESSYDVLACRRKTIVLGGRPARSGTVPELLPHPAGSRRSGGDHRWRNGRCQPRTACLHP